QGRNKNGPGMSRRQFLKGTSATAAVTALGTAPLAPAAPARGDKPQAVGIGPGPVKVELTVNGAKMTTPPVEPRVTLLDALDNNPNATPAEVEEALSGNICRCGTYEQMRHAIAALCQAKGG